jgi:hypothetical protein
MEEQLIKMVEADLREVVERELNQFLEHYGECQKVDDLWVMEDFGIGIEDVRLHGLLCDYRSNIFVRREDVFEIPQFLCWVEFTDPEHNFARRLAHINLVYLPKLNKCYIRAEIHDYDIREVAEHIVERAETLALIEQLVERLEQPDQG